MKYVGQQNIKKLCNFYVNDLHLSVMLLPYISRQIDEDVEITTIFEKMEKQDMEEILNKLNVRNRKQILNVNWFDSNKDSYDKINDAINNGIKDKKNITIIIGGNKKYILDNNKMITEMCKNNKSNIKIIDCYSVEEISNEMRDIIKDYDGVLNTLGEIKTSEIV